MKNKNYQELYNKLKIKHTITEDDDVQKNHDTAQPPDGLKNWPGYVRQYRLPPTQNTL